MSFLLDLNLLIALAWPSHIHHRLAQVWFRENRSLGWSTCPLTQTGFIRISSNPKFIDGAVSPSEAIGLLQQVTQAEDHKFWPDTLDFTQGSEMGTLQIIGHRQVTDAYLLALAIHHHGKLATLDQAIAALIADTTRRAHHLEIIAQPISDR
ncbi:MAG: VapC toxin family PIN domain ribonuclease [Synechococcaceae cyanobacterium SM2_3_1]|nr:VapC toxin family PIN domain ribonuclease [Synechococcaceae cyanobacterium SM2_3_1]